MGKLYYNRGRSDGIKNIVIGTFSALLTWLLLLLIRSTDKESLNLYHGLLLGVCLIVVNYLLRLIPFGQVFESFEKNKFRTYYALGPFKFRRSEWDQGDEVSLTQDEERCYWIVVRAVSGKNLEMDRCPTLKQSEERLVEFKKLFD